MVHVHLIQRHRILFHFGQDAIDGDQKQIFCVEESFLFIIGKSLAFERLQVVTELGLQVREGAPDTIHRLETFIEIVAISHEEAVEWEHLDGL